MIMKLDLPGTEFRVVFIPKGETPENYPAAQNDEHDIVEFYDRDYPHTPDGQFTGGRYRASTLLDKEECYGLDLCGQEPKWKVPAKNMALALDWLEQCVDIKREVSDG
jgi:hypothetical protein